jgi:hypothetical protein
MILLVFVTAEKAPDWLGSATKNRKSEKFRYPVGIGLLLDLPKSEVGVSKIQPTCIRTQRL